MTNKSMMDTGLHSCGLIAEHERTEINRTYMELKAHLGIGATGRPTLRIATYDIKSNISVNPNKS